MMVAPFANQAASNEADRFRTSKGGNTHAGAPEGHMTASQDSGTLRLAAIADVHCTRESEGALRPLFTEIARQADALVVCGDLTAYGLPEEAASRRALDEARR